MGNKRTRRRAAPLSLIVVATALVLLFGWGPPALVRTALAQTAAAPPAPGMARIWILRQFTPGGNIETPWIYINNRPLTTSQPGTIFYHDVPAGTYTVSVETCGHDVNQFTTLTLAPGSVAKLEVQSLDGFTPSDCPPRSSTYYVRPVMPQFLRLYLPQLTNLGPR